MEQIGNIKTFLAATETSRQPQALSKTEAIAVPLPIEKQRAMGDVIDRWRLNKGWNPLDEDSQGLAIMSWVNVLDSENVPATAYNELFVRALKLRASLFAQGKQPPDMGIELMLACWESLRLEIIQKQIDSKRILPDVAASTCPRCFGTGMETVYNAGGTKLGCRPRCAHAALARGEWLWEKQQADLEENQ